MGLIKRLRPRTIKIRTIFLGYLITIRIIACLLLFVLIMSYVVLSANGEILPGYFAAAQLSAAKNKIAASETIPPEFIPNTCDYAVFTKQGKFISGNLSKAAADAAWKFGIVKKGGINRIYHYLPIYRKNDICIVRYTYIEQFRSPVLQKFLPSPVFSFFVLFVAGSIFDIFLLASLFGKYITKKMSSLQNATEKIRNKDLEFTVESSGVREIDNMLQSLDNMKEALKTSLKKQWKMEKERRKQISALAHDIKTPLTVVRGNADLLARTCQTEKQKEYTAFIEESTHQMEQYIKTLIEISKAEIGYSLNKQSVDSKLFINSIYSQIAALAAFKKLTIDFKTHNLPESFNADSGLLQRALMNIASNAVDYSPENTKIDFSVEAVGDDIYFCIIDCGKGFSPDALKKAAQQFYMSDKSRTSKAHYGMGLFIAKSIAEQHGGTLLLENSAETGGGKVTVKIPTN